MGSGCSKSTPVEVIEHSSPAPSLKAGSRPVAPKLAFPASEPTQHGQEIAKALHLQTQHGDQASAAEANSAANMMTFNLDAPLPLQVEALQLLFEQRPHLKSALTTEDVTMAQQRPATAAANTMASHAALGQPVTKEPARVQRCVSPLKTGVLFARLSAASADKGALTHVCNLLQRAQALQAQVKELEQEQLKLRNRYVKKVRKLKARYVQARCDLEAQVVDLTTELRAVKQENTALADRLQRAQSAPVDARAKAGQLASAGPLSRPSEGIVDGDDSDKSEDEDEAIDDARQALVLSLSEQIGELMDELEEAHATIARLQGTSQA
eukprot:TRINITY_DN11597_c0_g1_i1.p1 TRINITY_DN11597_c0_g1~~TRINITY_DN11597_c0_g1_i1.p1  ORF type:complete len:325 (+),score=82.27 TRINITY_DN11597_c0_g1_i1:121-1095(+)